MSFVRLLPETRIREALRTIALERGVRILMAVESGSRAWGFESPDSDYDVRFVFARPAEHYLTCGKPPADQVEWSRDDHGFQLDMVGWDLVKTFRLLVGANPSLHEWLSAPSWLRYVPEGQVIRDMRDVIRNRIPLRAAAHHYISMARNNWDKYIRNHQQVRLKKYLYALRPALCAAHVLRDEEWPPLTFDTLVARSGEPDAVLQWARELASMKRRGTSERDTCDRILPLDRYLSGIFFSEGWRERANALGSPEDLPRAELDAILRREVMEGTHDGTTAEAHGA